MYIRTGCFKKGSTTLITHIKLFQKNTEIDLVFVINENTSRSYSRSLLVLNGAARSASGSGVEDGCLHWTQATQ